MLCSGEVVCRYHFLSGARLLTMFVPLPKTLFENTFSWQFRSQFNSNAALLFIADTEFLAPLRFLFLIIPTHVKLQTEKCENLIVYRDLVNSILEHFSHLTVSL